MVDTSRQCGLCGTVGELFCETQAKTGSRRFFLCEGCGLVFLAEEDRLTREAERQQYLLHDNRIDDPGYVRHLQKLWHPLREFLRAGSRGLDFGCGPAPVLAELIRRDGHSMTCYDPFFAPDGTVLEATYDFVVCSEAAEHFFVPHLEFSRMVNSLGDGGHLAVMTQLVPSLSTFRSWHYHREPTHVSFYGRRAMSYIAAQWSLVLVHESDAVTIFAKGSAGQQ